KYNKAITYLCYKLLDHALLLFAEKHQLNGESIAVNSLLEFRQHSEETRSVKAKIEAEDTDSILFFSQTIETIMDILY
ncbi:16814_t:CDS:2, partial [Cetraspora pellucida]